jgi:hypothetical protein
MPSSPSIPAAASSGVPLDAPDLRGNESPASFATEAGESLEVCRKLRTKFAFLPLVTADNEPIFWQSGDSSTAVYGCLRTMECAGPDGGLAHASLCRGDRACYACRGEG